jgi:3-oxoacyl-[acyl-carrier-protein] synthase III
MSENVYITGSGTFLPGDPIPFERALEVLGELTEAPKRIRRWIERTTPVMAELLDVETLHYGIDPRTREFTEDTVTMAVKAARKALDAAGLTPEAVDLITYGSPHQDQMPTASVRIQEALGIEACDELSLHANCTSAYKALYCAHALIRSGTNRTALVISSNMASSELRAEYYNQQVVDKESLFLRWFLCDGAGAVVLSADRPSSAVYEMEHTYIESVGGRRPSLMFNERPAYWLNPKQEYERGLHHLRQRFRNELATGIFQEEGGSVFLKGLQRMLSRAGVSPDTIKLFQVNLPTRHIAESVMDELERLGLDRSRVYSKLNTLGYSGPPMALICLDHIVREERLSPGDRIASFVTEVSKFMQAGYVARYHDAC